MAAEDQSTTIEPEEVSPELLNRSRSGRQAWREFSLQVRSVTPRQWARVFLVAGVLFAFGWLVVRSWSALIPFVIGAILAYLLLPVVNRLDRVMPRALASLLSVVAVLAFLVAFLIYFVPALAVQFERFVEAMPDAERIQAVFDVLEEPLEGLPDFARLIIVSPGEQAALTLRDRLDDVPRVLPQLLANGLLRLINIVGALIGLAVLPVWLLMVMTDQRKGKRELDRLVHERARSDFWAVMRIIDRSFRSFTQRQVVQGLVVGFSMFLALSVLTRAGIAQTEFPLIVGVFLGLLELIPTIGPIVAFVVLAITGALVSPASALATVTAYIVVHQVVSYFVDRHVVRVSQPVHPVILTVVVVILAEIGVIWALLAVPIFMSIRDVVWYADGRFSEPPRPAGVLPETVTATGTPTSERPAPLGRIPLAYRHGRAVRAGNVAADVNS